MKKLTKLQIFQLTIYWFANNFVWGALLGVTTPSHLDAIVGSANKASALSWTFGVAALVAMVVQPIAGRLSDGCTCKLGRRRPFILTGAIIVIMSLLLMNFSKGFLSYFIGFQSLQLGMSIALSGFQGLIPDIVPDSQKGKVSGIMGFMMLLGNIIAYVIAGKFSEAKLYNVVYISIGLVIIVALITLFLGINEEQNTNKVEFNFKDFIKGFYICPKECSDFIKFLLTSTFVLLGFFIVLNYIQYYLIDVMKSTRPEMDTVIISGGVLVGAAIVTIVSSFISDKIGPKKFISMSTFLMSLAAIVFSFNPSFAVIMVVSFAFGLGYGGYRGCEWSVLTACLPKAEDAAKDLGVYTIASSMAQILASSIGGTLIQRQNKSMAYTMLFLIAAVSIMIGSMLVLKIKRSR